MTRQRTEASWEDERAAWAREMAEALQPDDASTENDPTKEAPMGTTTSALGGERDA